ncbi:MAG: alpha-L-fucosidase, partial [Lentisphaerae bacterium]|nr:alpha-L-fucosidase [Lentisphaerota bacterium]
MAKKRDDIIEHSLADSIGYETYPDWLKSRLEWFMDMRFGMIIHWGPYSQWDCSESWGLVPQQYRWNRNDNMKCWIERDRDFDWFCKDYRALNRSFNPINFDPDKWASIAKTAGMKYVTYTTKHHDGFCMWDTKTTDYRITHPDCPFHTNPRANTVKEVFDAFRGRNMAISCYFSKSDWHCPWYWAPELEVKDASVNYDRHEYPEIWAEFVKLVHNQIEELMSDYGKIDVLWLDGGQVRPPTLDIKMDEIA